MSTKFNKLENNKKPENKLLIIDGLNLAFRFKHANKTEFAAEFLSTVRSLARSYACKDVVVLGDAGSDYRYSIYPEYKANRKVLKENQTKEEAEAFQQFLKEFDNSFELCSNVYTTIRLKGVEADDIAAYITNEYQEKYDHIWLISSDKDWNLLISDKVSQFSTHQRKETTLDNWNDYYDYQPKDHISIKVLHGDKGDNVLGVDGVGEKRAYNLVREYGSALDIYDALPIADSRKFMINLNNFKDKIHLNYELMDLPTFCNDAIGDHLPELEKLLKEKLNE